MSNYFHTSCNDDLKQLMTAWNLENILTHLIAEEINVETLQEIKLSHVKTLLYKFSLDTQIRFEHRLQQWRHKIGKPLKQRVYANRIQIINDKSVSHKILSGQCNDTYKTAINKVPASNSDPDLKAILLKCAPDGPELLQSYSRNQTFSSPERSHLINIIVNYYLRHDRPFNLYTSYELENSILSLFPSEKLDMYRNETQGKIYAKYLSAKAVYYKHETSEMTAETLKNVEQSNQNKSFQNMKNEQIRSFAVGADYYGEDKTGNDEPGEILLQTVYKDCRIFEPYLYQDLISAACSLFNIANKSDFHVAVNDCEVLSDDFKNIILQYYKLPTFTLELKETALPLIVTKTKNFEDFYPKSISAVELNPHTPANLLENIIPHKNSSIQIISNYLPDANDIRNIPALLPIVKMSDDGKRLENKHRATIAKAIVDECLNYQPERILRRYEFFTLTQNLISAFPREVEATYFIPAQPNVHARGKLWNAYNNKRKMFASSGVLERRHHGNMKRKHPSDGESEKTNDKLFVIDYAWETNEFSLNSSLFDWDAIKRKWSDTHPERREELLQEKLSPQDYLEKYSILKSNRVIELMEIDVNILHPSVLDFNTG